MLTFLTIVHLFIAVLLIIFVLLQDSKGGAAGVFGGGSGANSLFGSAGGADFLTKVTRYTAIIFACTCMGLAYLTSKPHKSIMDQYVTPPPETAPATTTPNPSPSTTPNETQPSANPNSNPNIKKEMSKDQNNNAKKAESNQK